MKSEHRHELAENDLSKLLGRWGADFDKHANTILTVLIVVALLAAVVIYWTRTSAANSAAGWTDLTRAGTAEDYQNVAEDYPGTQVAQWATLRAGDGFLREGILLSLTDRPASEERLAQARESYDALLQNPAAPSVIREQALLGYALTLETNSDGDTNEAIAAYEKLLEEFPDSRFEAYAGDRIEELNSGGAQDFYAWFHQLNPKPAERTGPQDQPASSSPGDLSNLQLDLEGSGIPPAPADGTGDGTDLNPFAAEEMKDEPTSTGTDAADPDATKPDTAKPDAAKPDAAPSSDSSDEPAPDAKAEGTKSDEKTPSGAEASDEPAGKPAATDNAAAEQDNTEQGSTEQDNTEQGSTEPDDAEPDASNESPAQADQPAAEADAPSE